MPLDYDTATRSASFPSSSPIATPVAALFAANVLFRRVYIREPTCSPSESRQGLHRRCAAGNWSTRARDIPFKESSTFPSNFVGNSSLSTTARGAPTQNGTTPAPGDTGATPCAPANVRIGRSEASARLFARIDFTPSPANDLCATPATRYPSPPPPPPPPPSSILGASLFRANRRVHVHAHVRSTSTLREAHERAGTKNQHGTSGRGERGDTKEGDSVHG